MGIKDEFHQKAILTCVSELLKQPEDGGMTTDQYNNYSEQYAHNLTQHSFSTLERCKKCNKYLRGLLHQGFVCQGKVFYRIRGEFINYSTLSSDCGLVAHRTCAATGLPTCLPSVEKPLGQPKSSLFGQGLCIQFSPADMPAPPVVSHFYFELIFSIILEKIVFLLQRSNLTSFGRISTTYLSGLTILN